MTWEWWWSPEPFEGEYKRTKNHWFSEETPNRTLCGIELSGYAEPLAERNKSFRCLTCVRILTKVPIGTPHKSVWQMQGVP